MLKRLFLPILWRLFPSQRNGLLSHRPLPQDEMGGDDEDEEEEDDDDDDDDDDDGDDDGGDGGGDDDDGEPSEGTTADELCEQGDARLEDETIPEVVAWESSFEAYMRAWHLDPSHPGALTRLAYMVERSKQQEYEVARGLYDLALQTDPGNLDALVLSGHNYQFIEGDVETAYEQYRLAVSMHPTSARATVSLASLLLEEYRDSNQAGQLFARAAKLDPLCADAWHGQAVSLLHVGKDEGGAEAKLERALRFDPSHIPSLFELARVRWRAHGNAEQAMALARRALNLDPASCHHMCQYGYLQAVSTGDLLGAEETYRRAVLLGPDLALPHCELAQLLIMGGGAMAVERKQEIQSLFDKALDLEPKNPKTLYQLAMFIGQEIEDGEETDDPKP
jgi:tetratricopeptide (TPR) repeat protein